MVVIRVQNLTKQFRVFQKKPGFFPIIGSLFHREYKTVSAIADISFTIQQGELVGFIGPNGAGKTTTLKCLSGLLYPTSGTISVLEAVPFARKPHFLRQISLIMGQKNQLWWDLPAIETFRLNKEIYDIADDEYKKNLTQLSELLNVEKLLTIPVRQLSLGERMKMELIAALLHKPKVLFLDEPTIGLDVIMQKKIRDFISQYNKHFQSTVILTSHYMIDVKQLCRRVIIIDHGHIVYDGYLERLIQSYADFKIVTFLLKDTRFDKKSLAKLGKIKFIQPPKVALVVPKKHSNAIASILLQKYQVEDLNIEEPEIEEVIRLVFSKTK